MFGVHAFKISLTTLPDLVLSLASLTLYKKRKLYKMHLCLYKARESCIYTYIFVPLSPLFQISLATLPDLALSLSSLTLYNNANV
ncbi:hypothetical protein H5410_032312 [Solanum commersonii]|uniref:Uncharacterized protein n=1 Tax=Solanum commersonii TaxID=4109 RepID=A0A9J5YPZ7_SOLCO|nr:hypothetical protein H5410_032312 [Solanum commersonii]